MTKELKPMYVTAIHGGGLGYRFMSKPTADLEEIIKLVGSKGQYILELSETYEFPHAKLYMWEHVKGAWEAL